MLQQLESKDKSVYLFPSPVKNSDGQDVPYTTITRVWYRIRKLAGIPDNVRIHDLRHSFLSLLARKGASQAYLMSIAGHSDYRMTSRYVHLTHDSLTEVANLGSVIVPKATPPATPTALPEAAQQPAANASTEQDTPQDTPASNILPFPKAA